MSKHSNSYSAFPRKYVVSIGYYTLTSKQSSYKTIMSKDQIVKHKIYNISRKICKEVGFQMCIEYEPEALDLIAELVFKKMAYYGTDLEAFQKHAKRSTINADDVKLLVRRNDSLKELVETKHQFLMANKPSETTANGTKRKRKTSA